MYICIYTYIYMFMYTFVYIYMFTYDMISYMYVCVFCMYYWKLCRSYTINSTTNTGGAAGLLQDLTEQKSPKSWVVTASPEGDAKNENLQNQQVLFPPPDSRALLIRTPTKRTPPIIRRNNQIIVCRILGFNPLRLIFNKSLTICFWSPIYELSCLDYSSFGLGGAFAVSSDRSGPRASLSARPGASGSWGSGIQGCLFQLRGFQESGAPTMAQYH